MGPIRLRELEPEFIRTEGRTSVRGVTRAEANGLRFLCPKCFDLKGRTTVEVHSVICHDPSVPLHDGHVGPGRWAMEGGGFDDLTLVAPSPSILLTGGCNAHFFVERGSIRFA